MITGLPSFVILGVIRAGHESNQLAGCRLRLRHVVHGKRMVCERRRGEQGERCGNQRCFHECAPDPA
jgi:hypothetical protein